MTDKTRWVVVEESGKVGGKQEEGWGNQKQEKTEKGDRWSRRKGELVTV